MKSIAEKEEILESSTLKLKQLCNLDTIICSGHDETVTIEALKL